MINISSTLAALTPVGFIDVYFRTLKNSMLNQGSHTMLNKTLSRMPDSSRQFIQGDPLKMIDWKAYARNDQLIVREVREDAQAKVGILVSLAHSMEWPAVGQDFTDGIPKAELAIRVGLALAYAHAKKGDLVDIYVVDTTNSLSIYKPKSSSDVEGIYIQLCESGFGSFTDFCHQCDSMAARMDLCWIIEDGLNEDWVRKIQNLSAKICYLHTFSQYEMDISWLDDKTTYFDADWNRNEYQGSTLKYERNYDNNFKYWRKKRQEDVESHGGQYVLLTDLTPISYFAEFVRTVI